MSGTRLHLDVSDVANHNCYCGKRLQARNCFKNIGLSARKKGRERNVKHHALLDQLIKPLVAGNKVNLDLVSFNWPSRYLSHGTSSVLVYTGKVGMSLSSINSRRARLGQRLLIVEGDLQATPLNEGIAQFYDQSSGLWEDMWGEHMHHGYYPKGQTQKSNSQAQIDMIEEVLKWANVSKVSKASHTWPTKFVKCCMLCQIRHFLETLRFSK